MDRLLQPDRGFQDGPLPQQRLIDHVGFFDGPPKDDGGIGFTDAMRSHHHAQASGRVGRFRDQNQAAGFAVESVYERDPCAVYDFESQKTLQFVPEGVGSARAGRVDQEICGFVNDQKAFIFVYDERADPAGRRKWNGRSHQARRPFVIGMVELKNVTRRYRQGENVVLALDDLSLRIETHDFVAVTGESGSGKSTFLHLVGGLDKPDSGEVLIHGLALHSASEKELTQYRARDLGIVFQFFNLLPTLNVLENVCVPLQFQRVKSREAMARAREMLGLVGMEKREHHFVHQLSGGEMQRTAIARALVHRPKLLLADEPTGNLDGANAEKVLQIFRRVAEEHLTTLIVVTHSLEVAEIAKRRIHLRDGKLETRFGVSK